MNPESETGHMRTDDIRGNFDMGTWFGEVKCIHGHAVRLFNLHRHHFVACDACRTYTHVGSNLMSNWRQENNGIWEENRRSIEGYVRVE
jgi:hypothetical protein